MDNIILKNTTALREAADAVSRIHAKVAIGKVTIRDRERICKGDFGKYLISKRILIAALRIANADKSHMETFCRLFIDTPLDQFLGTRRADLGYSREVYRRAAKTLIRTREEYDQDTLDAQLATAQQNYARLKLNKAPEITIDPVALTSNLESMTNVQQARCDKQAGALLVSVDLKNIVMSPSDSRRYALERLHNTIGESALTNEALDIELDPCTLNLWISSEDMMQYHFTLRSETNLKGYANAFIPHPHWIDENHPCLGDFEGPVTEAANDGDIETVIALMIMYLSQYNSEDTAGQYFVTWWRHQNAPGSVMSRGCFEDPNESEGEEDDDD